MIPPPDPLEEELRQLRPRALPPPLIARLGHGRRLALAEARHPRPNRLWFGLTALAAVLLLGLGSWSLLDRAPSQQDPAVLPTMAERMEDPARSGLRAVRMEQHLANRIDDGVFLMGERIGVQQFRYQFIDTVVWEDPRDGSTIEMSVPREEVVLVPLAAF